jgi:hypothetical protein
MVCIDRWRNLRSREHPDLAPDAPRIEPRPDARSSAPHKARIPVSPTSPDAFTLIDLRPLRSLVFGQCHKTRDADLVRTIHGFDALLVLTGSTAAASP